MAADREDVVRAREAFVATLKDLDVKRLVFIDETGIDTAMHERFGWAPVG